MELLILSPGQWHEAWRALPGSCREIYYHPLYVQTCAAWEGAEAHCLAVRGGNGQMLYSWLRHSIDGTGWNDAQTAYGYGGPLFSGDWGQEDRVVALATAKAHFASSGTVAEFVRCHTDWCDLQAMAAAGFEVFAVRTNVECDLAREDFTSAWAPAARRNLRRAREAGLSWRLGATRDDWASFQSLYTGTAQRLGMAESYRFDCVYFAGLAGIPGVRLVMVEEGGVAVAGAIVLIGGRLAHYHLGASDYARREVRPNDFLYFAMASCAREAGCARVVWGGGLSNDPEDTLFRFKTHFGALRRPVFGAGRVIDSGVFEELCRRWEGRNPGRDTKIFLRYRA